MLRPFALALLCVSAISANEPSMDGVENTRSEPSTRTTSRTQAPARRVDQNPARADAEYSIETMIAALQELKLYLSRRIQPSGMQNGVAMYRKAEIHKFLNVTLPGVNRPIAANGTFYQPPQGVVAMFVAEVKVTTTIAGMNQTMQLVQNIATWTGQQQQAETPQVGQNQTKTRYYLVGFKAVQGPLAYEQAMMNPVVASMMQAAGGQQQTPQVSEEIQALARLLPSGAMRSKITKLSQSQIEALQSGDFSGASSSSSASDDED